VVQTYILRLQRSKNFDELVPRIEFCRWSRREWRESSSATSASQHGRARGCQMFSFKTKNTNLGRFWRALDWLMSIYFMAIWNILQTFGVFYDHLVVHFVFIWYIFPVLVSCTKKNLATLVPIFKLPSSVTRGRFFVHFSGENLWGKFRGKFPPKNVGKKWNFPREKF
jgi:hypothetical protein